jgi:hypothetical protein
MQKYKKWYDRIIEKASNREIVGYTEVHHIIPKSLGGGDDIQNLVNLTAREHFICHILLTKFTTGTEKYKMIRAAVFMKSSNSYQYRYMNSRLYETARIEFSKMQSERQLGENNSYFGKKHSTKTKQKMSQTKKGKHNNSWNTGLTAQSSLKLKQVGENISKAKKGVPSKKKGLPGKAASIETRIKMSQARKGNFYWWNNGQLNLRAPECPGPEWKRGRLMSPSLYARFCKKISE